MLSLDVLPVLLLSWVDGKEASSPFLLLGRKLQQPPPFHATTHLEGGETYSTAVSALSILTCLENPKEPWTQIGLKCGSCTTPTRYLSSRTNHPSHIAIKYIGSNNSALCHLS